MILAEGSELDEYRQVVIRATTIESCLRAEVSMLRTQVEALARRVQGAEDLPSDDCVVAVFPLGNVVSMGDDALGAASPGQPGSNTVSQTLRSPSYGGRQGGGAATDCYGGQHQGMEATEVADTVSASARFITDDQGNMISDMFRAVVEIVDLCHGARSQNRHAVEARRRGLEVKARAQAVEEEVVDTAGGGDSGGEEDLIGPAGPAVVVGPPVQLNLGAAGHAFLAEWGLQLADEGDSEDDRSVSSGWGRQRPTFGPVPIFWMDNKVQTQRDGSPQ